MIVKYHPLILTAAIVESHWCKNYHSHGDKDIFCNHGFPKLGSFFFLKLMDSGGCRSKTWLCLAFNITECCSYHSPERSLCTRGKTKMIVSSNWFWSKNNNALNMSHKPGLSSYAALSMGFAVLHLKPCDFCENDNHTRHFVFPPRTC